jgi:hypothetical protein
LSFACGIAAGRYYDTGEAMIGVWSIGPDGGWAYRPHQSASLDDFQPLLPAEKEIVAQLRSGDFDRLGDGARPETADPARVVRAAFLRFLMLGGGEGCRPHEKGVRVRGAWISGILDLEACRVPCDVGLNDCRFEAAPVLRSAIVNRLFLNGSALPGLEAERLETRGGIYLRKAEISAGLNLAESRLGGNLECNGAKIRPADGLAIRAASIEVRNVLLRGADVHGAIDLAGAQIAADLDCTSAVIRSDDGPAIEAGECDINGSVLLRTARIEGEIRLVASMIGGDVDCTGGHFIHPGKAAIDLSRTGIRGAFFLRRDAVVKGALAMTSASIGTIHDEAACWPAPGDLLLNRCRYDAFIGGPIDARSRLDWLDRQTPQRWGEDFWPQPYEQLASVFRQMGHGEDARTVLIAKERRQRRARRARTGNPFSRLVLTIVDAVLGATLAYGRQPLLAFVWLALLWGAGVAIFATAEARSAFKPYSAVVLRAPEWTLCGVGRSEELMLASTRQLHRGLAEAGQSQLACFRQQREASSYPTFNPWMYSLDVLLPVLEMGQKDFWRPDPRQEGGGLAIGYFYFQSLAGWVLSLLAVAGFSGLVKSS